MALAYKQETLTKDEKKDILNKLKRVEGRIKGIGSMVEDDRSAEDVMMQLTASYESLRVIMKQLVKKHIEEGLNKGLISSNTTKRDEAYDKLVNDIFKYSR